MVRTDRAARIALGVVVGALLIQPPTLRAATLQPQSDGAGAAESVASGEPAAPFMRVIETEQDPTVRLDMAVRFFAGPEPGDPMIALASAIHVADAKYYALLQSFLDAQDLVLFEGVRPRGVAADDEDKSAGGRNGDDIDLTTEERIELTKSRLRFVGGAIAQRRAVEGEYPKSLPNLAESVAEENRQVAEWLAASFVDAWGNEIEYRRAPDIKEGVDEESDADDPNDGAGFDLISFGSDGEPGGAGRAADLALSDQPPLTAAETGKDPGIQSQLAHALGLEFQLEAMSHEGADFRNSDMSLDEVEASIIAQGGDPAALLGVLDGSSFMAGVLKFGLRIIEANPRLQAMTKVMLMEAFKSVSGSDLAAIPGLPPAMAATMRAIIQDRNTVVIDDLRQAVNDESAERSTIAVVYGAGHMIDLQRRLVEELDYRPVGEFWLPAIAVNLDEAGLTQAEIDQMRRMMKFLQP